MLSPRALTAALCPVVLLGACDGGGLPEGWRAAPPGSGPEVRWDLEAEPLPDIPLPNDTLTWRDRGSPTGRRLDVSTLASTRMERHLRQELNRLDGWGTFAPITVGFDEPIDTAELRRRQGRGQWSTEDFARHAVYLIDLTTGLPVPLDVNADRFPGAPADPDGYYGNDPHAGEPSLVYETRQEDGDGDGRLDPGEDRDFDGALDRPNTFDGRAGGTAAQTVDELMSFYERQTDTLVLRPILPLEGNREYAVVLTDRLLGLDGEPVRSPFEWVHHLSQRDALATLPERLAEHPALYGSIAREGWHGVAFAWSFTTQSIGGDLRAIRDGLYGRGPFADLAESYPPRLILAPLRGAAPSDPSEPSASCEPGEPGDRVYTVTPAELLEALRELPIEGSGLDVPADRLAEVLAPLEEHVSHLAFGFVEAPHLLGDPRSPDPYDTWDVDRIAGTAALEPDRVPVLIAVPRQTDARRQPFSTSLYAHDHGRNKLEALLFAGQMAAHGLATVAIDAPGHGLALGAQARRQLSAALSPRCLAPLGRALALDRARDLDGDDVADPGARYFGAHAFHTRDSLRQSVVDWMQTLRVVRSWDGQPASPDGRPWDAGTVASRDGGEPLAFDGDVDLDGALDRAGDLDGDGVPDLGGWDAPYTQWGSSVGAIVAALHAGVEPAIVASAPVGGGGGLADVAARTGDGALKDAVWLPAMGPIVASRTSDGPDAATACVAGSRSVFFETITPAGGRAQTEIGCLAASNLGPSDAVVLTNLRSGEVRCAGVAEGGVFRVSVPADAGDPLSLLVYDDVTDRMDFGRCAPRYGEAPAVNEILDTWRSATGPAAPGSCPSCAIHAGRAFELGSPLLAPAEGLGLRRQTPELRAWLGLVQTALDPADPVNYARRIFLDPPSAADVTPRPRSVMVMSVAGAAAVPASASYAYARAAGVLPFLPPDAPFELADWRAPTTFAQVHGWPTPDEVLVEYHVLEGLPWLERHPVEGAPGFLFDVDDLSDGQLAFSPDGSEQLAPAEGGLRPRRLVPPLRWGRESRPAGDPGAAWTGPWSTRSPLFDPVSVVLEAMVRPLGADALPPVDPSKRFDQGRYLVNVIGWYLASGGTELAWQQLEDPGCLEDSSCAFQ